jgi:hypothetical protein
MKNFLAFKPALKIFAVAVAGIIFLQIVYLIFFTRPDLQ